MKSIFLSLLITLAAASAETSGNLLEQLKVAAKAEAKAAGQANDPATQQRAFQWQQLLLQLDRKESGERSDAELFRAIEGIETMTGSEKLVGLCVTLSKQLRTDQEKEDAALIDEMEKGFAAALRSALAAKSFKEVDAPLAEVSKFIQKPRADFTTNEKVRKLFNQGQQVWQFLRQWQDLLAGVDTGDGSDTQQRLQNLLRSSADFSSFVPRSELLERMAEIQKAHGIETEKGATVQELDAKAREILTATHTLTDLAGSIRQLQELTSRKRSGSYSQVASTALQTLNTLERVRLDLDKGLSTTINLSTVVQDSNSEVDLMLSSLRGQLLLYALPRLLGVGEAEKPLPTDNVPTYLHRMTVVARERSDWMLLARAIELMDGLRLAPTASANDHAALQSFLAGLNQERAVQYTFAVVSYEAALKSGSQLISADLIGGHLDRIRKEHPEDYEQGVQIALNPPPATDPRSRMGLPSGFPYVPGMPTTRPQTTGTAPAAPSKSGVTPSPQPPTESDAAKPKQ